MKKDIMSSIYRQTNLGLYTDIGSVKHVKTKSNLKYKSEWVLETRQYEHVWKHGCDCTCVSKKIKFIFLLKFNMICMF
jgi:hypothetical protein